MFPRHVSILATLTAVATALAAALTVFVPDVLYGPVVSNANARGTALIMLVLGVPLLLVSMRAAGRGSWRGAIVTIGVLAYLLYNDVMLVFATPFNRLFLLYEAAFALTLFTGIAAVTSIPLAKVQAAAGPLRHRRLAVYGWVIIGLNVLAWLGSVGPATLAPVPGSFLEGTGMTTNVVIAQDFAFWLPGAAFAAWLLWQRRALGVVLFGAWLVWGFVESIGVAVDQTLGYLADPVAAAAAPVGVAIFVGLAVVGLVPLWIYLRPRAAQEVVEDDDARRAVMFSRT